MLLRFYYNSIQVPIISAQVRFQGRMESAHLPVDQPIDEIPSPLRAPISLLPKGDRDGANHAPCPVLRATAQNLIPQGRQECGNKGSVRTAMSKTGKKQDDSAHTAPNEKRQRQHEMPKRNQRGMKRPNGTLKTAHTHQNNATRTNKTLMTGWTASEDNN